MRRLIVWVACAAWCAAIHAAAAADRYLLYDYVTWEQMSKQRRGLAGALQAAHGAGRTLVLPPIRFHTAQSGVYDAWYPLAQATAQHIIVAHGRPLPCDFNALAR